MSNEEEFKKNLRNLVESKEFTFDESDWKKASDLLHPDRRPRRAFYYIAAGLALLISGLASYLYFADNVPSTPEMAVVPSAPTEKAPVTSITRDYSTQSPTAAKLHQGSASQPKQQLAGPLAAQEIQKQPALPAEKIAKAGLVKPQTNSPEIVQPEPAAIKPEIISPVQNTTPAGEPGTAAPSVDEATVLNENKPVKTEPLETLSVPAVTAVPGKEEPAAVSPVSVPETGEPKNDIAAESPSMQPETAEQPTLATSQPTSAAKPDTLSAAQNSLAIEVPVHKRILMNFEVGADYLLGWKNGGSREANGINPVVGVNYFNYLSDQLAISFGAQYTSVSSLHAYTHISKITHYDLGSQSAVTAITPQKIYYIAVPVKFNYIINDVGAFGFGVNFGYMLTVDSKVETYNETPTGRTNYKSYKASGYTEGFATFDTQLSLFYRRRIYKNLSVSAEMVYGLTDLKANGFFGSNTAERNKGLKLTLQYNLFK